MLGADGPDASHLYGKYTPLPGRTVVLVAPIREESNGIYIPETVGGRLRPDVGTVVAVGDGVGLQVGDTVAVRPYDGLWQGDLRFYGIARSADYDGTERVHWAESIPLVKREVWEPTDGVLIRRNKKNTGVEVSTELWEDTGEVVRSSTRYSPGDKVCFKPHMQDALMRLEFEDEDLWLVPSESLCPLTIES